MRLNTIKLAGFKSFVDPTKIPFLKPLTAVVGPNGCGKSNVIDAVRWVLGESSAKHLRGESMTDVIFNGSSGRRPVSVASVELVFDNPDGRLGGQYASYQTIAVKRQVDRQGESSYFLNGQKCRRKDVTELFLGTGLGARSYAIIEQGTISRLIESKPQDLRVFIEEAAGISRYKERRRDTETRIRHTRENLERLADIRHELASQLEKLAQQAEAAKRYRELKQQERAGSAQLLLHQYQNLKQQGEQFERLLLASQTEQAAAKAQWQAIEVSLTELNIGKEALERQEQQQVAEGYRLGTELARLSSQLEYQQRQHAEDNQQLTALLSQRDQWQSQHQQAIGHHQELQQQQLSMQDVGTSQQQQLVAMEAAVSEAEESLQQANHALQQGQELLAERQLHHQLLANKLSYQQQRHDEKQQALATAEQQLHQYQDHGLQATIDKLSGEVELNQELGNELNEQYADTAAHQQQARAANDSAKALVQREQQALAALHSRSELIDQLLAKAEANTEHELGVWQVTQVAPGWEKAAELVLEPVLQHAVNAGDDHAAYGFSRTPPQDFGWFSSEVNLAPWLQGVEFVDDKANAYARLAQLPLAQQANQRFVTKAGEFIGQGFYLSALAPNQPMQLLAQAAELEQQIQRSEARVAQLAEQQQLTDDALRVIDAKVTHLDAKRQQQQLTQQQLEQALTYARSQMSKEQQQLAQQQQLVTKLQAELTELELSLQQLAAEVSQSTQQLSEGEGRRTLAQQEVAKHQQTAAALRQEWQQHQQRYQQSHRESLQQQTALALSAQTQQQLWERLQEAEQKISALNAKTAQSETHLEQLPALEVNHQQMLRQQATLQAELVTVRGQLAQLQTEIDSKLLQQKQVIGKIEQVSANLSQQQLKREGINGQLQAQLSRLKEADIDEATELSGDIAMTARQQQLEHIRQKIGLLGAINLAAIDEYEQQSSRKQYLDEQDQDLRTAMASLEDAIRQIDKETRTRFKITFDQINNDFSSLFPKVFGGGSAYLALTDDDLLETGVSIMAQPPGKKNSTIHLLSGGEKALTALSLVFAIFRLNPAPFCMLDEVDAPLDDANVERFCRLLKEMSQSVQFIYISHNKITMEMADQLTGVTMHEPGVSRIVAVDIDEAVAMADAG
ncbi:chromosome segregation protein SMC [Shewanella sp. NIFS-20-20]|uniref:chromosome segregation protein SMC n=1 Tax=Shewanella sp. NIFS-20-20 TaxID=2853806 RepID=UPI001C449E90|nr:chromosome segregation protein SMC [Shewanella sp. NIFS-20-20]MBV7315542.1 chromosome segregation protein SMC [Shewanella sp. NIFS-20-20]